MLQPRGHVHRPLGLAWARLLVNVVYGLVLVEIVAASCCRRRRRRCCCCLRIDRGQSCSVGRCSEIGSLNRYSENPAAPLRLPGQQRAVVAPGSIIIARPMPRFRRARRAEPAARASYIDRSLAFAPPRARVPRAASSGGAAAPPARHCIRCMAAQTGKILRSIT